MDKEVEAFLDRPRIVRWLDDGSSFVLVRTAVLRLLGIVYFVAFASAYTQAPALIGERGLQPIGLYLDAVVLRYGALEGFVRLPSIFWIGHSDATLRAACVIGALLALAVILGVTNAGVMIALWVLQISLAHVGQIFWGYGWEIQLCETGVIAALLCPMKSWRPFASPSPPLPAIWMMRWLVVRIMLGAGLIKLRGDPCWRELTCLVFHYETQPNPSPVSTIFHAMPSWFHTAGALFNHFVEVICPLFVIGPRPLRRAAGVFFVLFQGILIASGNLSFLNWLTIVPALACFDDAIVPERFRPDPIAATRDQRKVARVAAVVVGLLSVGPIVNMLSSRQTMNMSFEPLSLVNTYGAFGTVTRERREIVIEGSADGETWKEYELPCKPGDVTRRPCLISPWHYRLDWQMWFAAMASYEDEPWIAELFYKMLSGERSIEPLFARDPFPSEPPKLVRALVYRYEMVRGRGDEAWWKRTLLGEYIRPLTKDDPELLTFLAEHGLPR